VKNMIKVHAPEILDYSGQEYTRVSFWPDYRRFGMEDLNDDVVSLMVKLVYDVDGSAGKRCKVLLNGKHLGLNGFDDYVKLMTLQ